MVTAGFVGILFLLGWATAPQEGSDAGEANVPLTVATLGAVEATSYRVERSFVGQVEAARESQIGFELGGGVADVRVDEGEAVDRGQALARLDTARLEARRAELEAALDQAQANLELARLTQQRVGEALELNAVSPHDWDEATQSFQARQAMVRRAASALRTVEVDLAKSLLYAPFDALVAERFVDEGEVIAGGTPVFALIERAQPEVRIGVAGEAVGRLRVGADYPVVVADERIAATVKAVLPVRNQRTRTVDVILTLHAELNGLRVGDLATLELVQPIAAEGFWLPRFALTEGARGLWAVYVAEPLTVGSAELATHRLARRQLELIHQESDRVFVRGTLAAGELVVREGVHRLVPDQAVRVVMEDAVMEEVAVNTKANPKAEVGS